MARKKRSSEEVDSDVADKTGTAPTKRVKEKSSTSIEVASSKNEEVVQDFEFVTFGRPYFDIRAELAEDEDFDSDDEDFGQEIQRQAEEESEKYTDKLLKDFPEHKWAVSKKGKALLEGYALQSMKRDQDSFNMYIYNDWSAYGEQEIAENMVRMNFPLVLESLTYLVALGFHYRLQQEGTMPVHALGVHGSCTAVYELHRHSDLVQYVFIPCSSILNACSARYTAIKWLLK